MHNDGDDDDGKEKRSRSTSPGADIRDLLYIHIHVSRSFYVHAFRSVNDTLGDPTIDGSSSCPSFFSRNPWESFLVLLQCNVPSTTPSIYINVYTNYKYNSTATERKIASDRLFREFEIVSGVEGDSELRQFNGKVFDKREGKVINKLKTKLNHYSYIYI